MTNIGTLFYILWFLGPTLYSFNNNLNEYSSTLNVPYDKINTIFKEEVSSLHSLKGKGLLDKIVIDAGHGGHDPGCLGATSNEKDITLKIALQLGKELKQQLPEVEVIFTRTTDIFIPLHKRIQLANDIDADVFISIHANAYHKKSVSGTEVFVMGLHTAEENLAVAKRENASILLELDFAENYDGFDPNSVEAQIILSMYQNAFLDQSIILAKKISDRISLSGNFVNRGVKQAGFVILRKASMPSVLVETGFLSNFSDEQLLNTEAGQNQVAHAIAAAVVQYKEEVDREAIELSTMTDSLAMNKGETETIYRVQVAAISGNNKIYIPDELSSYAIDVRIEGDLKKILVGKFREYEEALSARNELRKFDFSEAFVVAYKGSKRISIKGVQGKTLHP